MYQFHVGLLSAILVFLIILSAFFSGAEIGMMSLNRYRLRHLVRKKNRLALRVYKLLQRPDRLLGLILIGNNFANIFASAIATVIAVSLFGDVGVAIAAVGLTLVVLIFAEMLPKTIAALYPQKVAFLVVWPLSILLFILSPLVWLANCAVSGILALFGLRMGKNRREKLSTEELRTVVHEASEISTTKHKDMLIGVLDLEQVTVQDIMMPRNEIVGIDLEEPWEDIVDQLQTSQYTRLPVYHNNIDQVVGMLHLRKALRLLIDEDFTKESLVEVLDESYFIPETTSLHSQLEQFQKYQQRISLVVDEYGDIQGLVTLEDILEEVVGEFTTDLATKIKEIEPQEDGSVIVEGSVTVRELNRAMGWKLPVNGPKTLNGLIVENLQAIPAPATSIKIAGYALEILQVKDNRVKSVKIVMV